MVAAVCEFLGASLLGAGVTGKIALLIISVFFRSFLRRRRTVPLARAFPIRVFNSVDGLALSMLWLVKLRLYLFPPCRHHQVQHRQGHALQFDTRPSAMGHVLCDDCSSILVRVFHPAVPAIVTDWFVDVHTLMHWHYAGAASMNPSHLPCKCRRDNLSCHLELPVSTTHTTGQTSLIHILLER